MDSREKKRRLVSYENMSGELLEVFNEMYPRGESDFFDYLVKYPKADGTSFYALTVETSDSICLVKVPVQTDAPEDVEKWLEGEEAAEVEQVAGTAPSNETEGEALPDDNISDYSGGDDSDSAE